MANGDKAGGLGWTLAAGTDDLRTGYDKINYALDRAAEQRITLRDEVLPAINQPIFLVRGLASQTVVKQGEWKNVTAWLTPTRSTGFTRWSAGQLTIAKSGMYRVAAHAQFPFDTNLNGDFLYIGAQLVKNTTSPNTAAGTVVKNVPGEGHASVELNDIVPLVAGDIVTLLVRQNNQRGWDIAVSEQPYDMTLSLEWVRA